MPFQEPKATGRHLVSLSVPFLLSDPLQTLMIPNQILKYLFCSKSLKCVKGSLFWIEITSTVPISNLILPHYDNLNPKTLRAVRIKMYKNFPRIFPEDTNWEGLKFDNDEDGYNSFRKIISEVADGFFGKKVRNAAINISKKSFMFKIEEKRLVHKLSDESYENKRNEKKVEKAIKYRQRKCEGEAMDKTVKDLEDAAIKQNSKILYWHSNKLRESSQSRLVPVKDRNKATISYKERVKEGWREDFENVLNWKRVAGNNMEEMKKLMILWM